MQIFKKKMLHGTRLLYTCILLMGMHVLLFIGDICFRYKQPLYVKRKLESKKLQFTIALTLDKIFQFY